MDDNLKFYFLAEESGWDCSSYAFSYREKLLSSGAYQVLTVNVLSMKNHLSEKAQNICDAYTRLNKESKTLKEVFILENTLNYLALHSFPEYYLNPFSIHPDYSGDVTSIGELIFDIQGKELSLNEWIQDETVPIEEKKEEIGKQLDEDLLDMNRLVNHSLDVLKKRAFSVGDEKKELIGNIMEGIFYFLIHLFFLFLLIYPFEPFKEALYLLDPGKIMTYVWFLYPITLLLFDISFLSFHCYKARISEPYNYARRFLRKDSSRVFEDLKNNRDNLFNYICGAINNKILLKNDIKDFSRLSSAYVDFDKVLRVYELKDKKAYRLLHSLLFVFGTLAYLTAFFSMIVYIVALVFGGMI